MRIGTRAGALSWLVLAAAIGACQAAVPESQTEDQSSDCASCHLGEFRAVADPVHEGAFPMKCAVCHTRRAWEPARLNHRFTLDGAHYTTPCFDCHTGSPPRFEGTGNRCVDCHRREFDENALPWHHHLALTCASCHSTTAWSPARGDPEPLPLPPPPEPVDPGMDAGVDAGRVHRHHVDHPVDIITRPSQRGR